MYRYILYSRLCAGLKLWYSELILIMSAFDGTGVEECQCPPLAWLFPEDSKEGDPDREWSDTGSSCWLWRWGSEVNLLELSYLFTVESSLFFGHQCLWLSWVTLAHEFPSPRTYIYKYLFNIHLQNRTCYQQNYVTMKTKYIKIFIALFW